jgi:hypothetical protein
MMLRVARRRVAIRVRNELLAAAIGAEVEIAAVMLDSMRSALGHLHPTDDIEHCVRTRQSMIVMRICSAVMSV